MPPTVTPEGEAEGSALDDKSAGSADELASMGAGMASSISELDG